MIMMPLMIEAIRKRVSCRTFTDRPVERSISERISEFLGIHQQGPFGNQVRFRLIDTLGLDIEGMKTPGTYGVIRGARLYIVGAVAGCSKAMEDYGYVMEQNILMATQLGLGTCWLGGTFDRSGFARRLGLSSGETVPAISPVGYADDQRSLVDRLFRLTASSDRRKPWHEIFFHGDFEHSLSDYQAEPYALLLESVRLAPSASNRQPWRIVKERERPVFHFFLKRTPGYGKFFKDIQLQNVDMGIALCHFELSAKEMGFAGRWQEIPPLIESGDREYIATWMQ